MLNNKTKQYLKSPIRSPHLLVLLMIGVLYERLNSLYYITQLSVFTMAAGLIALWMKISRWFIYLMVGMMVVGHMYIYTQEFARFDYDITSTRDEAAEASARAFLEGKNPWSTVDVGPPDARVPVSTGPAGILLAIPFVMMFDDINWLLFTFWVIFFISLLVGDIYKKNSTFPVLTLLVVMGIFHINLSIQMSLDELYYPVVLFPLGFWAITRNRFFLAGVFLGVAVMFRLNYVFGVFSFFVWLILNRPVRKLDIIKLCIGGLVAVIAILAPFWVVGGDEFLRLNSFTFALRLSQASQYPKDIFFFEWLNRLSGSIGSAWMGIFKMSMFVGLFLWVSSKLRHLDHPFWHVAIGTFISLTVAWFPAYNPIDYELLPLLPAFLAVAYSNSPREWTG